MHGNIILHPSIPHVLDSCFNIPEYAKPMRNLCAKLCATYAQENAQDDVWV